MRVFTQAHHRYPASNGGPGGGRVFDVLVKGLAELGHDVFYCLAQGAIASRLKGVTMVDKPIWNADIAHIRSDSELAEEFVQRSLPWVATCHVDLSIHGKSREIARKNWIYVSRELAATYQSNRFVLNGIDPAEFIYSASKSDYFLFVSALPLARLKGLEQAISIAHWSGIELYVAGSDVDRKLTGEISRLCHQPGVTYVGEIAGTQKAELFAGARALLFPTQLNEAFGLVLVEAMMSGTPIICSANGACPEIVSSDVGFVCQTRDDYMDAVQRLDEISPQACREKAMSEYHYLRMAADYVVEYHSELSGQDH